MDKIGLSALLAAGVAEGVIGPFGAERFDAPAVYTDFRLELPQIAAARLSVQRGNLSQSAGVEKASRDAFTQVSLGGSDRDNARIEVSGYEGQAFSLRAVRQANRYGFDGDGAHRIWLDVAGEGGDDPPATALLARIDKQNNAQPLASETPKVGQGRAYRGKFNLRGPTTLLFEAVSSGPIAIDAKGVKVRALIAPALGDLSARADGRNPLQYDLQTGFYLLSLEPQGDTAGVIDVTLVAAGIDAGAFAAGRAPDRHLVRRPSSRKGWLVSHHQQFGPEPADRSAHCRSPGRAGESAAAALARRRRATFHADSIPKEGKIVASDQSGADVAFTLRDEKIEDDTCFATVTLARVEKPRAVGLVFVPSEPQNSAEPDQPRRVTPLVAAVGKASFFDIDRDEKKYVRFEVQKGGLYRIENWDGFARRWISAPVLRPPLALGRITAPAITAL